VQQLLGLGQPAVWERIQQLAARLRRGLAEAPGVTVRDRGRLLCGIVSWTKVGMQLDTGVRPLGRHCRGGAGHPPVRLHGVPALWRGTSVTACPLG
jgi:hypothetical protein